MAATSTNWRTVLT